MADAGWRFVGCKKVVLFYLGGAILECPIRSLVMAIFSFLLILLFGIFLVEMACNVVYFGSICRSPNSSRFGR